MKKLLRRERYEHRNGGSRQSSLDFDTVHAERQSRYKTVLLLKVQPYQRAVIFLRHACRAEKVVVKLLFAVRKVHDKECHEKHPLIPALQVTENVFRLARIGRKVGRDDIHIEPFTHRFFLRVDLHAVKVGDLALDRLDRLVLIHAADM